MKIFKFNPNTGKRGDFIANKPVATYTAESVTYMVKTNAIQPIDFNMPKSSRNQEWQAHIDAGTMAESYLSDDWVCFCLGEYRAGEGSATWSWVVLPPKSLIVKN